MTESDRGEPGVSRSPARTVVPPTPLAIYLLALAILVSPSALVWLRPAAEFNLFKSNFDWLCGALTPDGKRPDDPLLFSLQMVQVLLFFVMGAAFVVFTNRVSLAGLRARALSRRLAIPAVIAAFLAMAGLPWMNPDLFYVIGHGWSEVANGGNIFERPLLEAADFDGNPMYASINPLFWKQAGNYGPLNQMISAGLAGLSFGDIRVAAFLFKLCYLLALAGSAAVLFQIARREGLADPGRLAVIYFFNPISLVAIVVWGHNDVLQNFGVLLCILALQSRRFAAAGAAIGAAVAVKFVAILLVPLIGLYALGRSWARDARCENAAARFSAGFAVAVLGLFAIYPGSFDSFLYTVGADWSTNQSGSLWLFAVFGPLVPDLTVGDVRFAFKTVFGVAAVVLTIGPFLWATFVRRRALDLREICQCGFWIYAIHFLLPAPTLLEWYFTWMLGFALLAGQACYERFVVLLTAFFSVLTPVSFCRTVEELKLTNTLHYLFYAALVIWLMGRVGWRHGGEQPVGDPCR